MRIDRIKIKNFKGFSDEEFRLNPQFTVFIGDNAKGKTSVLDALAVAVGSYLRGIDVARHEARSILPHEIRVKTILDQPRPQLPVEIEAFGEVNGIDLSEGWKRTVKEITKKTTTTFVGARNIESIAQQMLQESRTTGQVTFPLIAYHGTGRLWAEHEEKKNSSKKQGADEEQDNQVDKIPYEKQGEGVAMAYIRCLSPKSSSKAFLSWYKTYEDEVKKFGSPKDVVLLEAFKRAIMSMIPQNKWTDMTYSFKDEDLIGLFKNQMGTDRLLFRQLSDGYRNLIGMVADIAYRCIKLNPHLGKDAVNQTPGIVLIDELDLHLHPNWQRQIVADLKKVFPKIQFIATTHSPFIVQSLRADELINLDSATDSFPQKQSLEEVAEHIMGVTNAQRSTRYQEMLEVSEQYFKLLDQGQHVNDNREIEALKQKLDELIAPFYEDAAFVSFLKFKKLAKLGE
jgi:predicted ATP-binding protein involved in virulence